MNVLKGILSESKEYYLATRKKILEKIASLPKGNIKERVIAGKKYYYLQQRIGDKIAHKYLGKDKPEDILRQISERKSLKAELKKVEESLKILKRSEGRKRG
ncbi:MAG: hypothetical protein FJZ10_04690 [Candidatus Omnitrophica bacterium]|nr:hypothetical protein [Candidatus Omnitrophota bacterium]